MLYAAPVIIVNYVSIIHNVLYCMMRKHYDKLSSTEVNLMSTLNLVTL